MEHDAQRCAKVERRVEIHYYVTCPDHGALMNTPSRILAEEALRQHKAKHHKLVKV